jgi:hypothetical protein
MCAVVTVIFGVCKSVRLLQLVWLRSEVNKSNIQSKIPSRVTLTRDNIINKTTAHHCACRTTGYKSVCNGKILCPAISTEASRISSVFKQISRLLLRDSHAALVA